MLSKFEFPRLSYGQLFSFQVLYSNNADSRGYANAGNFGLLGRKKGEWKRAILEVDYTMGTLFLQDKDRIIMSETFEEYKRYKATESSLDDTLVSVHFKSGQWEIMAQNAVEKNTLQHLLECIAHDLGPQEAAELGLEKGLVGVDKEVMKYGLVQRRAKTAYKKDERFLLVVPGKLLLFKGMDIAGKHVRFVTSLLGATTRLVYGQLEFEVLVPDSKSLNLLPPTAEELTGWIGAIEKSTLLASEGLGEFRGRNMGDARADKRREPPQDGSARRKRDPSFRDNSRDDSGGPRQEAHHSNRWNDYEGGNYHQRDGANYQRDGNRQVEERERRHANLDDPVQSRGDFRQINDRSKTIANAGMERSGRSSREGRDLMREHQAVFERQVGSQGRGLVAYNQAGPNGADTDYYSLGSPRENRAGEGDYGLQAEEDGSMIRGGVDQELPLQEASSSNPTPKSRRCSVKELQRMLFYLNLYRRGLVESSTQTNR